MDYVRNALNSSDITSNDIVLSLCAVGDI